MGGRSQLTAGKWLRIGCRLQDAAVLLQDRDLTHDSRVELVLSAAAWTNACALPAGIPQPALLPQPRPSRRSALSHSSPTSRPVSASDVTLPQHVPPFGNMGKVIRSKVPSRLFRTWLQDKFFDTGASIHKHAGKVLFCGLLALVASCAALKSAAIETRVDKLWVAGQFVDDFVVALRPVRIVLVPLSAHTSSTRSFIRTLFPSCPPLCPHPVPRPSHSSLPAHMFAVCRGRPAGKGAALHENDTGRGNRQYEPAADPNAERNQCQHPARGCSALSPECDARRHRHHSRPVRSVSQSIPVPVPYADPVNLLCRGHVIRYSGLRAGRGG